MNIKRISKNTILISDFFDVYSKNLLKKYVVGLFYKNKKTNIYSCSTHYVNNKDFNYLCNILKLDKITLLANKTFGNNYKLSNICEVIKMLKWDFLGTHTDSFHDIQGVLYLSDVFLQNGWEFIVENNIFIPKIGDIILFKWNVSHWVWKLKEDYIRFSISFWFKSNIYE